MKEWNDDKELVSLIKGELYTAVVGDIMDKMGYTHPCRLIFVRFAMICLLRDVP